MEWLMHAQLPFGLDPKQQRLEELIARTDSVPVDFDLYGVVDMEARDLLTKVRTAVCTEDESWPDAFDTDA